MYDLGSYDHTTGDTTFYNRGDTCNAINGRRRAEIQWHCGNRDFEIISVTEPSTCFYHLIGEFHCNINTC